MEGSDRTGRRQLLFYVRQESGRVLSNNDFNHEIRRTGIRQESGVKESEEPV